MNPSATLFLAVTISMTIGVFLPDAGKVFAPYILVWLGGLLFLNLIQLNTSRLIATIVSVRQIAFLSFIKLVALPLALYTFTSIIYPTISLPVLLLSGISTGLGAPFVANFIGSRLPMIVGMIITTSLAVPFVLPLLVRVLFAAQFTIPIIHMIVLLAAALFCPLLAGWVTKKFLPKTAVFVAQKSLNLSIVFIVLINITLFSEFSALIFHSPFFIVGTILIAFVLFSIYGLVGYAAGFISTGTTSTTKFRRRPTEAISNAQLERTAAIDGLIVMAYINNILVAVFAEQFFGIQTAALAALYNIPYYMGIVILKKLHSKVADKHKLTEN